jgi:hypothetical protein
MLTRILHPALRAQRLALTALAALLLTAGTPVRAESWDHLAFLSERYEQTAGTARALWEYAEVGYQETRSSELLQRQLIEEGFSVEAGVAGIPTAFVATYGSGGPVLAVLGEFDALPGITQDAVPSAPAYRREARRPRLRSQPVRRRVRRSGDRPALLARGNGHARHDTLLRYAGGGGR